MTTEIETPMEYFDQLKQWLAGVDRGVILNYIVEYGVAIFSAVLIFAIGRWLAKTVSRLLKKLLTRNRVDDTLISFFTNITYYILLGLASIAAISALGVETTSLAAMVAAAGLAIGLALQGSLSNLAAGVMIIMFRPFRSGDYVSLANNTEGTITEVNIFNTHLLTVDNRSVIVPNNSIVSDTIINFTSQKERRIDLIVGVSYRADLRKVKVVLADILAKEKRILKVPAPVIAVQELADSSVNLVVRPWVKSEIYWDVRFDLLEAIKLRFDEEGISIPFPQREVHVYDASGSGKNAALLAVAE